MIYNKTTTEFKKVIKFNMKNKLFLLKFKLKKIYEITLENKKK